MNTIIENTIHPLFGRQKNEDTPILEKNEKDIMENVIFNVAARTIIFELSYQKPFLKGTTEQEQYRSFLQALQNEEYQEELKKAYPVLFAAFKQILRDIHNAYREIKDRFYSDLTRICNIFFDSVQKPVDIVNIEVNKGDSHHDGRRVAILSLDNGRKIVYKPRSLKADIQFQKLLEWISSKIGISYQCFRVLDCGDYGWCEYIESKDCISKEEVSRYYYRNGIIVFLVRILGSSDLHYENLVANGEYPVLIDLETVLSGGRAISEKQQEGIEGIIRESVLQSGLLPLYIWGKDGSGINISALSGKAGQILPIKLPIVVDAGTAEMRIEYREVKTKSAQNLCRQNGLFCEPAKYVNKIIQGFRDAYYYAMDHPDEIDRYIHGFSGIPIRKILRDTQTYAMMLSLSWHPKYLTNSGLREELLLKLDRNEPAEGSFEAWKLAEEQRALLRGDIPYFWYDPVGTAIFSDRGSCYKGYFREPVIDTVRRRICRLSENDMRIQEKLIRSSLGICEASKTKVRLYHKTDDIEDKRFYALRRISSFILNEFVTAENGEIGWIQSILAGYKEQGLLTRATDAYLYNGLSGILLFFMKLSKTVQCNEYQWIIEKLKSQISKVINDMYCDNSSYLQTGIYNGEASLAFVCQILYLETGDFEWLMLMKKQLSKMEPLLENDRDYDLLSGNAGAIMAYLNAYELTLDDHYLTIAVFAGDLLISNATKFSEGWYWQGRASRKGLTGMAHGNAGIMMSLCRLAAICQHERFYDAACKALQYEDAFYSYSKQDWMDLRFIEDAGLIHRILKKGKLQASLLDNEETVGWVNVDNLAWCHGKAGIMLSRHISGKYANGKLSELLSNNYKTKLTNVKNNSFNLCHGMAGISAIDMIMNGPSKGHNIERILSKLCNSKVELNEVFGIQELQNYGLMSGITGAGYLLMSSPSEMETLLTGDISFMLKMSITDYC